jgi:PAS domain S-box-containing protein
MDERSTLIGGPRPTLVPAGPTGLLVVRCPRRELLGAFFELASTPIVIGRSRDAAVHLDDAGISRHHVRLERGPAGELVALDLSSTNGTFLNGVRIHSAVLAEGDTLRVGANDLQVVTQRHGSVPTLAANAPTATSCTGSFEWDAASGRLTFSGGTASRYLRGSGASGAAVDPWSLVYEEDRPALRAGLEAALQGGRCELEFRIVGSDGGSAWVLAEGKARGDPSGRTTRVAGTATEITERNRAESELRRRSLFFNSHSDAVAVIAAAGEIRDWNPSAERLFGWSRLEVLGQLPGPLLAPQAADHPGTRAAAALAAGELVEVTETLLRRDGTPCEVQTTCVPLLDPDGRSRACVVLFRDEGQRRRALAQMQMTERLASIGTLAAGVAHEVNNPLAFIRSNLAFARSKLAEAGAPPGGTLAAVDEAIADSEEGLERIRVIVEDLKAFSDGSERPEPESVDGNVDMNKVVQFALRVAEGEARRRARLVKELNPVPAVIASEARLGQVLINLVLNAAQAVPEGRPDLNEIRVTTRFDARSGRVVVEVSDTGAGIRPENLRRIFDPFFTTKPAGIGTGLGLFVCQGILASLGGEISVESTVGRGTTFRVTLPAARPEDGAPRG